MSRRGWITLAITLIGVAFAIRFGLTFPWDQTLAALADADWLLLAGAAVAGVISLAAKGAAWHLLLRRLAPLRFSTAQTATFVGAAVNTISISVSGEAARAQLAGDRDGVPFAAAAASLVATRVVEAIGLIVFLALTFIILPPWPAARPIGFGLVALAGSFVVGYRLVPWSRVHSQAAGRWHETFVRMAASNARGGLAAAVTLAAFSWLAQWLTYHWSIAATHTAVTPAVSLSTLVMANIAGILRLTPGNIGVMQGSLILGMHAFEIPAADALAAGLALQAVMALPVLVIGIAFVGGRGFRQLSRRRAEVV